LLRVRYLQSFVNFHRELVMGVGVRILKLPEQSDDHLLVYFDGLQGLGIATVGNDLADGARIDV
jgi:hypothetical protein